MISTLVLVSLLVAGAAADGSTPGVSTTLTPPPARAQATPAIAPADTSVRIPGTPFRLGWKAERGAGFEAMPLTELDPRRSVRQGETHWFGAPARATLTYVEGRLAQVRLSARGASARLSDYIPDDLRRRGYRRISHTSTVGTSDSEWLGPTHARLTIGGGNVTGEFSPAPARSADDAPRRVVAVAETLDFTRNPAPDSLPAPLRTFTPADPVRPRMAVEAQVFGRVLVVAEVDTMGLVERVDIQRGIPELNAAALDWASQVRFEPYRHQGRAQRFRVAISVAFLPVRSPGTSR